MIGVGKIDDIYAGVGVDRSVATSGNADGLKKLAELLNEVKKGLIFINLVDFDMLYGHRRNPEGYAKALEAFDLALGPILSQTAERDLILITADHGCDPTYTAHTDHTREYIPLLIWSAAFVSGQDLGTRETFADLGATLAAALGVEWDGPGLSCLPS